MPDDEEPKIIADDDWKAEAQREKDRLAKEAEKEKADSQAGEGDASPFLQLLDLLAQQAVLTLGGAQLPDGRTLPPNPEAAKHFIDMIADLEVKTQGNLPKEEAEVLTSLVSRLRWAFSMGAGGAAGAPPGTAPPGPTEPPGGPPPSEQGGQTPPG